MPQQITLEEALKLVTFYQSVDGTWYVVHVFGDVCGDVSGDVYGSIRGRKWKFVETPKERLKRLVKEGADEEVLLNMIDQLEDKVFNPPPLITNNPGNPIRLDEGHVQRGASGQGPRTPKPDITPKGQGTKGGSAQNKRTTDVNSSIRLHQNEDCAHLYGMGGGR